jgi:hypothetical protein
MDKARTIKIIGHLDCRRQLKDHREYLIQLNRSLSNILGLLDDDILRSATEIQSLTTPYPRLLGEIWDIIFDRLQRTYKRILIIIL